MTEIAVMTEIAAMTVIVVMTEIVVMAEFTVMTKIPTPIDAPDLAPDRKIPNLKILGAANAIKEMTVGRAPDLNLRRRIRILIPI